MFTKDGIIFIDLPYSHFLFLNLKNDWKTKRNKLNDFATLRQKFVDELWFRYFLFFRLRLLTQAV